MYADLQATLARSACFLLDGTMEDNLQGVFTSVETIRDLHINKKLSKVLCCLQSTQPVPAARMPYRVKVSAGKRYAWCACGHSQKQPFCDGAHKAKAPSISPLRFTPDKGGTLMLCACKQTKNAPYCDGSHFKVIFRDLVKSVKGVFK